MSETDLHQSLWPTSLKCYDITLSTDAENLALDEALLAAVDADPIEACLRFWQPKHHVVVLGRSNRVETEVNTNQTTARQIPILRRSSGGGTVLLGPGCLCFSLVLPLNPILRQLGISQVTKELMSRTASSLRSVLPGVEVCGTSDLAQNDYKFSGNAQRWLREAFIHHGTLLFDFDLALLQKCLGHPSREPIYRNSRSHQEFVKNISLKPDELKQCLRSSWNAVSINVPQSILLNAREIAVSRYESREWKISPNPASSK